MATVSPFASSGLAGRFAPGNFEPEVDVAIGGEVRDDRKVEPSAGIIADTDLRFAAAACGDPRGGQVGVFLLEPRVRTVFEQPTHASGGEADQRGDEGDAGGTHGKKDKTPATAKRHAVFRQGWAPEKLRAYAREGAHKRIVAAVLAGLLWEVCLLIFLMISRIRRIRPIRLILFHRLARRVQYGPSR